LQDRKISNGFGATISKTDSKSASICFINCVSESIVICDTVTEFTYGTFTASELAGVLGRASTTFDTGPRETGHLFIIIIVILDAGYKTQAKKSGTTIDKRKTVLEEAKGSDRRSLEGNGRIFSRQDKIKSENRSRKINDYDRDERDRSNGIGRIFSEKRKEKKTGTTTTIEKKIVLGRIVPEKTVLEEAKESPE